MKIKEGYKILLGIMGALTIVLVGCGSNKELEVIPSETPAVTAEITKVPTAEITAEPPTVTTDIEEGLKDTGEAIEEDIPQTPLEEIGGEGMVDDIVPDLTQFEEQSVESPVIFKDGAGEELCLFVIESIQNAEVGIEEEHNGEDKKVVIISYSYKNLGNEGQILFDDMSFKLLENDTVWSPYFSAEISTTVPSNQGETATGQVAFLVNNECQEVTLVLDNASVNAKAIFKASIE